MAGSYREILRSTSIMGGASVANIGLGLLRMKAAALLIGAAGVGLVGLYQNVVGTVASAASLGFGNTGVRQVAEATGSGDEKRLAAARRALFFGTAALAALAVTVLLLFRTLLSRWLFGDTAHANALTWLAVPVALTMAATAQTALLTGFRRIGEVARTNVAAGVLSTLAGIGILLVLRERGIIAFVTLIPTGLALAGWYYAARLPKISAARTPRVALVREWRVMIGLGAAITASALALNLAQLAVRGFIQKHLGSTELGQFQAVWAISITYVGFVLQAMGTDYFPRLAAARGDDETINRLVNEQTEVALLLAAPVLLMTAGAAPWILHLLYSSEFLAAAPVLRWQILGDLLKIASWPIGFVLLAAGSSGAFLICDFTGVVTFAFVSWLALPLLGLQATGVAFLAMYGLYLPVVFFFCRRITGFGWTREVGLTFVAIAAALATVSIAASLNQWAGAATGALFASGAATFAFRRLVGRVRKEAAG